MAVHQGVTPPPRSRFFYSQKIAGNGKFFSPPNFLGAKLLYNRLCLSVQPLYFLYMAIVYVILNDSLLFWETNPPLPSMFTHTQLPQPPPIPYYAIFISDRSQNSNPTPLLARPLNKHFLGYPSLHGPLNNFIYKCVE